MKYAYHSHYKTAFTKQVGKDGRIHALIPKAKPGRMGGLFTMFKRFHDHVEGSGIGLYMIKKMIENTGGKIEVESQAGKGSTFKVYFKR